MSRIIVRGISSQTGADDLTTLFSKVVVVEEVYIPPATITGLRRDFAIVRISGGAEEAKKCAKSLNGALWKGAKLNVEMALEWYQDRLQREKIEHEEQIQKQVSYVENKEPTPLPPLSSAVIRLRKIRLQELPATISMQPAIKVGGRPVKQKKLRVRNSLPCGTRLIFDESLLERSYLPLVTGNEMEVESEDEAPSAVGAKSAATEVKATAATTTAVPSTGEMAAIVQKLSTGEVKAIGGGARKGFGTISAPAIPPVQVVKPVSALSQEEAGGGSKNGRKEVHCCIEENEQFIPSYLLDEEESEDDEPCVTEADLQEETLERERARAMDVFERMLSGELPATKDKKTLRKEAQEKEKEKKKHVGFAEEKNVEHQIVEEEVVPVLSTEAQETLDILNELKNAGNAKPAAVPSAKATASAKEKSAEGKSDKSNKSEDQTPAGAAMSKAESEPEEAETEEDVQTTKDGYAKMNQLKNIFYREGGVHWGNDGTLSGAIGVGSVAQDPLFLEAEKRGIDIRAKQPAGGSTKTADAGALFNFLPAEDASASGGAMEGSGTEDKGMLFGFFAEPAQEAEAAAANPFLTSSADVTAPAAVALVSKAVASAPVPKKSAMDAVASAGDKAGLAPRTVSVNITAAEMVAIARKFGREKPVDVLTSEWRDGKDRLVLDYKRKRKDMKRRTAAWSSSNLSNAFGERAAPRADAPKAPTEGGGTNRGGPHYLRGRNRGGAGRKKARKA